jgi:DNA polymerase-3 subunit delta'
MQWLAPVREEFRERVQSGRLAHALLLTGPAGTGKQELGRELATSLLCLEDVLPACGRCRSCQLLGSGAHPDFRLLTFETNDKTGKLRTEIVIEQVRNLISSLQLTTTISPRKVALLNPAEGMNRNAANALLKTLEEPPGETVLLLVSHDPGRLPITIRSRCQNLQVRLPEPGVAKKWLLNAGEYDETEVEFALNAAAGSPLGALNMLRQESTADFRMVSTTLDELLSSGRNPGGALATFAEIEPDQLWRWLSLQAAAKVRQLTSKKELARHLSKLQTAADRNRKLLATPVRKDLLLQDWLIQWAGLIG